MIGRSTINELEPGESKTVEIIWDTSDQSLGDKEIWVVIAGQEGEEAVEDNRAASSVAIVEAVAPDNVAPVSNNDSVTVGMDTRDNVINVLANDSDADGDALTISILTQPANGTASVVNNQLVYTPNDGFLGSDTLTYQASDGRGGFATGTVTINVTANSITEGGIHVYLPFVTR